MGEFAAGALTGAALAAAAAAYAARRKERRLGRFLSFAAHELTTPVTAVSITLLNFLQGAFGKLDARQEPWLEMMREQTSRLGLLIGELRDFSDLALEGALVLHREEVVAGQALEAALRMVRHGCAQSGVALGLEVERKLPVLRADPDRLVRALGSLLLHARKLRGEGDIEVSARSGPGGRSALFEVRFQGSRVDEAGLAEALELYYPAGERRRVVLASTGLGLGVAREVARAHGGDLEASADGLGGVLLRLTLPARRR